MDISGPKTITTRRRFVWSAAAGGLVLGTAAPFKRVLAAQKTLRFVDFGPRNSLFAVFFFEFAKQLKDRSGGEMQAQFLGGPEVVGVFQASEAIAKGVFDMGHQANSFYAAAMPEAIASASGHASPEKLRASGAAELYGKVMREKVGTVFLGFPASETGYMVLSKKPIRKLDDFKGLKLRSIPIYDPVFKALGASTFQTAPAEVYTALERGVVDGLGWPEWGIIQNRLHEVAKFWTLPAFYSVRSTYMMNPRVHDSLAPEQKKVLMEAMIATESWGAKFCKNQRDKEFAEAKKLGVEIVNLPEAQGRQFLELAQTELWARITKASPQYGPQLKAAFDKADQM